MNEDKKTDTVPEAPTAPEALPEPPKERIGLAGLPNPFMEIGGKDE